MKIIARIFITLLLINSLSILHGSTATKPYTNSHFPEVNDVLIHYRQWTPETSDIKGNIFLVHGFGGSTFSWEKVADSLANIGYKVIAVDVPPFGYSDKSPKLNQSLSAKAELMNSFLNQEFNDLKWHLAGHSMGGGVVQAMVLIEPENYLSVNFVSAAVFSKIIKGETLENSKYLRSLLSNIMGEVISNWFITESRIERYLDSAYGTTPTEEQINEYMAPFKMPETVSAIINSSEFSFETHNLNASELTIPWLAIWGDSDSWVPVNSREHILNEMNPENNIHVIENCGHNPMETHREEFLKIWISFLEDF